MTPRRLDVPGTSNFRPLGGHDTPTGRLRDDVLWRADGLADLGEGGRAALTRLGVRTVVDLREDVERELHPDDVDGLGLHLVCVPILGTHGKRDVVDLETLYRNVVDARGEYLGAAVAALCAPGALPAVVHCAAGKDRTGLISGLLLSALGVDDDTVAADYAWTSELLSDDDLDRITGRARQAGMSEQTMAVALDAPAQAMRATLAHVRTTYGSARDYLLVNGVEPEQLDALAAALRTAS